MNPRTIRRAGTSVAVSILLLGLGVAAAWVAFASNIPAETEVLAGELAATEIVEVEAAPLLEGMRVAANFQFSQPRDPFRALIVEGGVIITGGSSSGGGGTVEGTVVKLVDIVDVGGELRAKVQVGGVEYDVGVGESFATNFKIVSLDEDSAVILFGDNAFELQIGQEIIK